VGAENFERALYREIYPSTDLLFHGARGGLEYDFRFRPGADPANVRLAFEGPDRFELAANGDLILHIGERRVVQRKPVAWQDGPAGREPVPARFRPLGGGRFGFDLGAYDPSRTLLVDPFIDYLTYLGEGDEEILADVAVDAAGNAYVVGYTASSDFPVNVGDQGHDGDEDAFIAKFSPDGSTLVYATFLGGRDDDRAWALAVNQAGEVFVAGETRSDDFPASVNAFLQRFGGGGRDGFAAKLSATGASLEWATWTGRRISPSTRRKPSTSAAARGRAGSPPRPASSKRSLAATTPTPSSSSSIRSARAPNSPPSSAASATTKPARWPCPWPARSSSPALRAPTASRSPSARSKPFARARKTPS